MSNPPIETTQAYQVKSDIIDARAEGRANAARADNKPLAAVAICQAYFRMVAQMAIKSPDPAEALDRLLAIHRDSARIELRTLREAGL